jgi:hypothetical protein
VRVFGGIVPWVFGSLPLDRWSGGLGRLEFLRPEPTAWPRPARRLPSSVDRAARQGAMAFATLERYVGWPALQGAIRELARASGQRSLPRADVDATIARALGQDLSWFVTAAFERPADFSYLVHSLSTEQLPAPCPAERCYRTSVVVARRGGDVFTGSSVPPDDGFESGDAMTLRVSFVDGGTAAARWDGRAATRAFTFESAAPPAFAALDPDRVLLLDDDYLDNLAFAESPPGPPVEKWVAYWMVWLQGAILDYGSLF